MSTTKRTLQAVPDAAKPLTETAERLWRTLQDKPGSTAVALSTAAGIGKSTAPKILGRWEKSGLVIRTPGIADGGSRPADRWSIASTGNESVNSQSPDTETVDNDAAATTKPATVPAEKKRERLAPGALRGQVEDYLRDNPGAHTPNSIGKALTRSAGAVHNALEKLVKNGDAVRTSDKPKKYALTAEADT